MKIKNTRELRLRARGHARADHITQGTYGNSHTNGKPEFEGCAIGCLATPHRQSDLRSFIKRLGSFDISDEVWRLNENAEPQLNRLRREFGISRQLARMAEALFEGFSLHSDAIDFIPAFASALNEGADLKPAALRREWQRLGGSAYVGWSGRHPTAELGEEDAEDMAPKFLAWLRAQH